jgi:flagellar hook assembly protein FlgD
MQVIITIDVNMDNREATVGDHFENEVSEALEKLYGLINWSRDPKRRSGKTRHGSRYGYEVKRTLNGKEVQHEEVKDKPPGRKCFNQEAITQSSGGF